MPIRIIRRLPAGRKLVLRIYNRMLMHFAPHHRVKTYFGAELECDVRDMIQATLIHFRAWEPNVSRVLERLVRPGDTVVDIGANIGYFTLLFSKGVGETGKVIAIEALPKLAAVVEQHVRDNRAANVRVVNVAVADRSGQATLYEAPSTNIGMTTTKAERGFPASAIVAARPITEILTADEMSQVALIKIDIEGAEVPVLDQLLDHIERFPRLVSIAVEASVSENPHWHRLFERFRALGYVAYDLENRYDWLSLMDETEGAPALLNDLPETQTDILFTKSRL